MIIMMNKRWTIAVLMIMLSTSCDGQVGQVAAKKSADLSDLPTIGRQGRSFPYIEYVEITGKQPSLGKVFFLFPMRSGKRELLSLEYDPKINVEDLFGEDLIGENNDVTLNVDRINISYLPISLPLAVSHNHRWPLKYIDIQFSCSSGDAKGRDSVEDDLAVSCSTGRYTLQFRYNETRGITEFQDFCGSSICTYKLESPIGLLSKTMAEFMDLPVIEIVN
jgi:hypothetical protein